MSADGPKYDTSGSNVLCDGVALTHEAINRYRERTPHGCAVPIATAYERGEDIEHPSVVRAPWQDKIPERARVYTHPKADGSHDWTAVFLIVQNDVPPGERPPHKPCDYIVSTVVDVGTFEHGPSRAYLHSHGPHGRVDQ